MSPGIFFPLAIATLAGMGVGSGGLFILFLTEWAGLAHKEAQGLNLAFFALALGAALLVHLRRHPPNTALLCVILSFGVLGAFVGALLATVINAGALRFLLGLFLAISGALVLFRK